MRRALTPNGLSLFFLALFLATLVGQAVVGHRLYNVEEIAHAVMAGDQPDTISLWRYVTSSAFGQAVMENWQSEYLQFSVFLIATVYLVQQGSTESKQLDERGRESDEDQQIGEHAREDSPAWARAGGLRTRIFSNSLLLVMGAIFAASWFAQSVTGHSDFNAEQLAHEQQTVSWLTYVGSSRFWEATLQNWQSEFLAVGSMVVLSIYLRQRGSAQSKPVGSPHSATAEEG